MYEGTKNKIGFIQSIRKMVENNRLGDILVQKGIINNDELSSALKLQSQQSAPLGQILVENAIISPWQLKKSLIRQTALRGLATGMLFIAGFTGLSASQVNAEQMSGFQLASVSSEFGRVASYPNLLGTAEKKDRNLKAFTKWTTMFKRFDRQLENQANIEMVRKWQGEINQFQGRSMKAMVSGVNDLVNKKRYIIDKKNWGKSDYWATPVEFLKRGGDCEDFAIAKYAALRSLGFPEERLRIAIVQDTKKGIPHAVLIAYTDEGAYLLDNQIKSLVNAERKGRYRPIFSINRTAWWLHKAPTNTVVASAN